MEEERELTCWNYHEALQTLPPKATFTVVTFTSYGRADQLQVFLLLRLNCKLLTMLSDAAGFPANEDLGVLPSLPAS